MDEPSWCVMWLRFCLVTEKIGPNCLNAPDKIGKFFPMSNWHPHKRVFDTEAAAKQHALRLSSNAAAERISVYYLNKSYPSK